MAGTRAKDPLRILEAIYTFDNDDDAWLNSIADTLEPYAFKEGIALYISELGERHRVSTLVNRTRQPGAIVHAMAKFLPHEFYRRLHLPMPLSSAHEMWPTLAAELGGIPDFTKELFRGFKTPPAWAFCGGEIDRRTVLVVFHCRNRDDAHSAVDREALGQLGAHLGSALRLRSVIAPEPAADDASVGAILSPEGKVLHATDDARDEAARTPLIDAVRRSERSKLRSASAAERLEVWTALVEGKWSILESIERDGKRLLLAYRNAPATRAIRELLPRERAVAQYAALGHPLKYIAYELGISIATAALDLETAMRKLGITTRAELIQLFVRSAS